MSLGLAFPAFPEERVLFEDDRLLVIDKPVGIAVHGGGDDRGPDLVCRLQARARALGRDDYLRVRQHLGRSTSGVMYFIRQPRRGVEPESHGSRTEQRSYVALVAACSHTAARSAARASYAPRPLEEAGVLLHHLVEHKRGESKVVTSGGRYAATHFRVLEREGGTYLVQLRVESERKHQARAQLAARGFPVVGDFAYGGQPAPRLMLHADEMRFADRSFGAPLPSCFSAWLETGQLTLPKDLRAALRDAGSLRWRLSEHTNAFRWVNDEGDLLPGVVVDVYAEHVVLSVSTQETQAKAASLAEALSELGAAGVYLKVRHRAGPRHAEAQHLSQPLLGTAVDDTILVREGELRLGVSLAEGSNTGLFVDQRDNRELVKKHSKGLRVLNLFCHTGSFSAAAALGGAREVTSVDLSKKALARCRDNFILNGLETPHTLRVDDAAKWLRRAANKGLVFDLAVLDPPSFSTAHRGIFSVKKRLMELAALTLRLLPSGGNLLVVTNHRKTSQAALRKMVHDAARSAKKELRQMKDLPSPRDCPPSSLGPEPSKSVWVEIA